ncbi:phytoene desaturase family protein [Lignipirellula cremea]|uniref:Soluble pyridine nucleotide transhydrogenase n=1 Tax=Lignipirellula cremea TaxID=2528010 RepID=A0A518DMW0_9BACT|nr:NAD(P)/FAD-dependent oxidoreductase [Lignipirellula cremea]QDU93175.1 soluble pyridine nucleotide transhydrogenase [Lignipirellula cremea]
MPLPPSGHAGKTPPLRSSKFEDFPPLVWGREPAAAAYDAVVVGSGPNGLAAAITLAEAGRSVCVIEGADCIGGGMRSDERTLPGFTHDVCSAVHALGVTSPFFRNTPLQDYGLEWVYPPTAAAHVLDDGAALALKSLDETCAQLGVDGAAWRRLMGPLVAGGEKILQQTLGPFRLPRHPFLLTRFGLHGMQSAVRLASRWFQTDAAQGLFAGMAAHSILPLETSFTGAVGLMLLITAHLGGWPVARGGSQQIANAMARRLVELGGEIVVGRTISAMADLPAHRAVLFDLSPGPISQIAGDALPERFHRSLRKFRHGPGLFKIDYALDGPIPWKSEACRQAGTVHLGGPLAEVAAAERAPWDGCPAERPFVLVAQQSQFDPTRAPAGKQTGWAYCHAPAGSDFDFTERIEAQIERFAPGFRDLILAKKTMGPPAYAAYNPNYIGGDITGGVMDIWQLFTRPTCRLNPYTTPNRNIYICSASTPPGGGVHGMCGYYAAQAALKRCW